MDYTKKFNQIILVYLLFVFILFCSNLIFEFELLWGLNHLLFIEKPLVYLFVIPFTIILITILFIKESFWANLIDKTLFNLVFVNKISFIILLSTLVLLFYFFRVDTYFLGDGYAWISSFGHPDSFLVKPTEFLSSYIIRDIQFLLGGYTKETSLLAFQVVSIVSGILFFLNLKNILDLLLSDKRLKVFTFLSFVFSGLTLLFMGYVEFYPMLWMTASFYLYFSLKSFESPKYFLWSILFFLIMILIHAQTVYLSFGFIYLLAWRKFDIDKAIRYLKNNLIPIFLSSTVISVVIIFLMYQNYKIAQILLPLFSANTEHPGYFIFSVSHIFDILNLILLLFPFIFIFIILIALSSQKIKLDNTKIYFILSSIGSLLFLLFVNPYIGFARDWDLMSMTLFFPFLLCISLFDTTKILLHGKTIIASITLVMILSSSFVFVNVNKENSLHRFESVLKINNGIQFKPGWTILYNYLEEYNYTDKKINVQKEMDLRFFEYDECRKAYNYLRTGNIQESFRISNLLTNKYPDNIDFIHLRSSIFTKINNFDSAQFYLDKGLSIQDTYPSLLKVYGQLFIRKGDLHNAIIKLEKANSVTHNRTDIIELLSVCYIRTGNLEKAKTLANEIYTNDTQSPSYHLILMILNLQRNKDAAKFHYEQFVKFGKKRSDYETTVRSYAYLLN